MPARTPQESPAAIQAIVDNWPDKSSALAEPVRELVRRTVPTSWERAYPGWNAVGFRDAQAGYFCGIFPVAHGLDLVFEHGAALPDPTGLFAQRPQLRQVRVVELRTAADLRRRALADLLRAAVAVGSIRRARTRSAGLSTRQRGA